jgi:LysM repeat protein
MPSQAQDNDASAQTTTYTLRPGDNLTRIAARYGTSVDAILAANGVANPNRIYAGQSILIPTGDDTSAVQAEAPASDDTSLADAPSASDDSSAVDPTTYTVQRGDSAIKIARLFGIDEGSLLDANGITNPNRVYVGQVLTIPGSSS